jgi:hypothetical protein
MSAAAPRSRARKAPIRWSAWRTPYCTAGDLVTRSSASERLLGSAGPRARRRRPGSAGRHAARFTEHPQPVGGVGRQRRSCMSASSDSSWPTAREAARAGDQAPAAGRRGDQLAVDPRRTSAHSPPRRSGRVEHREQRLGIPTPRARRHRLGRAGSVPGGRARAAGRGQPGQEPQAPDPFLRRGPVTEQADQHRVDDADPDLGAVGRAAGDPD